MHLSMGCPRMGEGGGGGGVQPTGIRLDTLNVPRVGNLTQPLSWKVKDGRTKLAF